MMFVQTEVSGSREGSSLENKQNHLTGNTYRKRNRRSETATLSRSCALRFGPGVDRGTETHLLLGHDGDAGLRFVINGIGIVPCESRGRRGKSRCLGASRGRREQPRHTRATQGRFASSVAVRWSPRPARSGRTARALAATLRVTRARGATVSEGRAAMAFIVFSCAIE